MLDKIDSIDKALFLFLNGLHTPSTDRFWMIVTSIPAWIPLYIALLIWIMIYYKKDSVWIIIGAILVITLADQFTSGFMKPFFGRLRPCHDPGIGPLTHVVGSCGGLYGFASGHSANSFGLAMYVWLVFRHNFKWVSAMFIWAALVALSRIMVGVHYPVDILTGGMVGVLSGWLVFRLVSFLYFYFRAKPIIKG